MTNAPFDAYATERPSNTLGIAGFVCALLGLLTGGHLLSPAGLILSLVALGRRPRGWAIAGVILGFLGTCGWAIVLLAVIVVGAGIALAVLGIFVFSQAERIELTTDMAKISMRAEEYRQENRGIAPADLAVLALDQSTLTDPWGRPYSYELRDRDPGYDIVSDGQDGKSGTADDVRLSTLDKYWEGAGKDFKQQMEEFDRRQKSRMKGTTTSRPAGDDGGGAAATQGDSGPP